MKGGLKTQPVMLEQQHPPTWRQFDALKQGCSPGNWWSVSGLRGVNVQPVGFCPAATFPIALATTTGDTWVSETEQHGRRPSELIANVAAPMEGLAWGFCKIVHVVLPVDSCYSHGSGRVGESSLAQWQWGEGKSGTSHSGVGQP